MSSYHDITVGPSELKVGVVYDFTFCSELIDYAEPGEKVRGASSSGGTEITLSCRVLSVMSGRNDGAYYGILELELECVEDPSIVIKDVSYHPAGVGGAHL